MVTVPTRQESKFFTTRLDNGLQVLGQQIPGVESAAAVFWARTGTRDERPEEMGISHFLEHMAFRRTEHFSGEEVDRRFEELGAEHNAGTWLEMTFYWARVLGENLQPTVELLSELMHPILDAEDFDQERNVILEEIARYQDMPAHLLFYHFMQAFFGDHPLGMETLGTPETIGALRVEQMREYWQTRYGTSNLLFAVAGNFEWDQIVSSLQSLTSDWPTGSAGRQLAPVEFRPAVQVLEEPRFVQEQIAIGVPTVARNHPAYYPSAVLATILGDETGSRLYWALHQAGLVEDCSASVVEFEDNGMLLVHLATEPARAVEALQVTQRELERIQRFDITQPELDRAKAKLNSSVVIGGESTNERVMTMIRSWLTYGKLETLEDIRRKIEGVTLADLRDLVVAHPLYPNQVITALGPMSRSQLQLDG